MSAIIRNNLGVDNSESWSIMLSSRLNQSGCKTRPETDSFCTKKDAEIYAEDLNKAIQLLKGDL